MYLKITDFLPSHRSELRHSSKPDPSEVAAILGRNPNRQAVKDMIYAVMTMDDVKKHLKKKQVIFVGKKKILRRVFIFSLFHFLVFLILSQ